MNTSGQFTCKDSQSPKTYYWVSLPSTVQVQRILHERETQKYVYCSFHTLSGLLMLSKTIPAMCSFLHEHLHIDLWHSGVYRVARGECKAGTTKGFVIKRFAEGPLPNEIQRLWDLASSRIIICQNPDAWLMQLQEPEQCQLDSPHLKEALTAPQWPSELSCQQGLEDQSELLYPID